MSTPTNETILAAHVTEMNSGRLYPWTNEMLTRPALDTDDFFADAGMVLRVTYRCADDPDQPDTEADYALETNASDASTRDAESISLHPDVYAVAIYASDANHDHVRRLPVAIMVQGSILPVDL